MFTGRQNLWCIGCLIIVWMGLLISSDGGSSHVRNSDLGACVREGERERTRESESE